ncbi:cytochrome P450 [Micromonospora cathayae]|uniref:Cytochrome P450 n=1 Tax=Micromonospora cathayae TaxID=3028804 RepID=A0ABY7ZSQ9_9ACTN|nr:cytochrome P450 [Micromonospora sp. HUAS 3]WDZ85831.1 cytochrome P450 [Micromonospora sp. HUAS 3]
MSTRELPIARLDFEDEAFQTDPWPLYDWHLTHAPVHWSASMNSYFVFGYRSVRQVLTSTEFTAYHPFRRSRAAFGPSALDSEGSTHNRYRGVLAGPFRPKAISGYAEAVVGDVVSRLLDDLLDTGDPAFVDELAWRLPTRVACRILGLPESDDELLYRLMRPLILFVDHVSHDFGGVVRDRDALRGYLRDRVAGGIDPLRMLRTMAEAPGMSEPEVIDNAVLVLAAATETTCSATVNLVARVAAEPGLFARIRADRTLVPAVVTETLRHEPPLHVTLRYAATDVTLEGVRIERGSSMQVCLASANRDPAVFAEPHVWNPWRTRATPLTFGMGRHHCLGSGLAQLELETVVGMLADRLTDLWVVAPDPATPRGRTFRSVPGLRLGYRRAGGRP